jgi:Zn-dependent peptidase ImmA (M78 family)/DNA-binding XRE family transcriptional regulator
MNSAIEKLSPVELGERLRLSREAAKLTQTSAAETLGVARTTLVAMEQGQRKTKIGELHQLSKLYGTSLNNLLRTESVHVDVVPKFRKALGNVDSTAENSIQLMNQLVKAEVELENLLGVIKPKNYPPERPLLAGDVRIQAEQDAQEIRYWFGLGMSPVQDMASLLEQQAGVRVFVRKLDGKVSGLYAYDAATGPCVILNANHPKRRRNQTGAHELGHFISTRFMCEVLDDKTQETAREERYANCFARAFLTPARAVIQKYSEIVAGAEKLQRAHIIRLSSYFNVSSEAMTLRLEELKLVKSGAWDWFKQNGGITQEHARIVMGDAVLDDSEKADAARPLSQRLTGYISEAWTRELLSEAQIASLVRLERVEVRKLIDDLVEVEGNLYESPSLL